MNSIIDLPWLTILIVVPLAAATIIWLVPPLHRYARQVGLAVSLVVLVGFIVMAAGFDVGAATEHQFVEQAAWIPQLGASYALGINGLGLVMVGLSVLVVPLALLASWREQLVVPDGAVVARRQMGFVALVLALEALMVAVFAARDVFLFYVVFEAMLVPVYFLIGNYGGPKRRHAAVKFLIYSLASGLVMLVGVIAVGLLGPGGSEGFLIDNLAGTDFGMWAERWLFISFFIAFAVKAPMWPVHTWLPDAAQQGSPGTSALLVGVLDKVGTFGMLVLCLPLFPDASRWAAPVIIVLAVVSILYGALLAVGQRDIMRLIAFTSVSHFGFIVLGIFIRDEVALTGAMLYMVAHGVSTSAWFLITGFLTQRGGTQQITGFGGMQRVTPIIAGGFLTVGMATLSLPGLSAFLPEYLVLLGTFRVNIVAAVFAVLAVIIAAIYVLLPYQRMFTGPVNPELAAVPDLGAREKWVMGPFIVAILALGFFPGPILDAVRPVAEQSALEQPNSLGSAGATTGAAVHDDAETGAADASGPADWSNVTAAITTAEGSGK